MTTVTTLITSPPHSEDKFTLYTYYRSSCSARLRIALNLKNLSADYKFIHLLKNEQSSQEYSSLNPSCSVPTLQITKINGDKEETITITQSLAALEYLDEAYPETFQLLPSLTQAGPELRATIRTLCQILVSDVQPVTNLRVLAQIAKLGGDKESYAKEMTLRGLRAYEAVCARTGGVTGQFSVSDQATMADVCLVPAVWAARRWGIDLEAEGLIIIERASREMEKLDSVKRAHWQRQVDTPTELR